MDNSVDDLEKLFHVYLNRLGAACGFELTEMDIELWDERLSQYGYDIAGGALKDILVTRRSRDPMPSIADILGIITGGVSDRNNALAIANAIITTFKKWSDRYCSDERFQEWYIEHNGDAAWAVLQSMGGYIMVFDEYCDRKTNLATLRAQLRETACSVIERARAGQLHIPIALPEAKEILKLLPPMEIKILNPKKK